MIGYRDIPVSETIQKEPNAIHYESKKLGNESNSNRCNGKNTKLF